MRFPMDARVESGGDGELEERSKRIVETAVELAEQGGFEAVRLRDVAAHAGVALGTLYRRFRSKEDLLVAALDQQTRDLERRVLQRPPRGEDASARVAAFFSLATRGLCRKPNLARALVKALASGEPAVAKQVASFHDRMENLIVVAIRGRARPARGEEGVGPSEAEQQVAYTLNLIWFALLVSWAGGLIAQTAVTEQMAVSGRQLLGTESRSPGSGSRAGSHA